MERLLHTFVSWLLFAQKHVVTHLPCLVTKVLSLYSVFILSILFCRTGEMWEVEVGHHPVRAERGAEKER